MKTAAFHLLLILTLVLFSGCGGGDEDKPEINAGDPPAETPEDPPPETPEDPPADEMSEADTLANKMVDLMGIEGQIPMLIETLAQQARDGGEFTDAQVTRLMGLLEEKLTTEMRPFIRKLCTDYFSVDELKGILADEVTPALSAKMDAFIPHVGEESKKWGFAAGKEAAETILAEEED